MTILFSSTLSSVSSSLLRDIWTTSLLVHMKLLFSSSLFFCCLFFFLHTCALVSFFFFFFFNDPAPPEIYPLPLHDALPISAGMPLVDRPEPQAAINDVIVQVHASGFVPTEMEWPSTWADRVNRDRTPSIPGHELAGVVTALGYGTTGLSVGQRVFGLADWHRDGTLAEYVAIEARNLAPLPGDVDFTVGASLPVSGLTAWQGLFEHGRFQVGQSVLVHGAAGGVGSVVMQLARQAGAHVIG